MTSAARLRRDGRPHDAVTLVAAALDEARSAPEATPFRDRVLLALTLADLNVDMNKRCAAAQLLRDEAAFAEDVLRLVRATGSPDQVHIATVGCYQLHDRAAQIALLDRQAPEIDVVDWVQGESMTLAAQRGRVVLLEFWTPSCRSCSAMFPFLDELHRHHADHGLTVIGVTSYRGDPPRERDLIRRTIDDHAVAFGMGVTEGDRTQRRYGARGVPTFALIDRAGIVRVASSKPDKSALRQAIAHLLDGAVPVAHYTEPAGTGADRTVQQIANAMPGDSGPCPAGEEVIP
ncbi:TlpA family protein disulfide reductase [Mycobacterium sp. PS03-16]|uniref:TlpA family protein disulfide reductase n=1 Tax=Mycobacterium sp. PS03-16 TaxID=2559611 RepID=UPI001073D78E|nr:TlpA disulfide reductase family protein [Mycobacterium sp. PS03-16]TFV58179.1 TlpA family protein disulfide reductase [Mycobacterium sp. PS03-16]